jgi:HK97 family phage major capsid protein
MEELRDELATVTENMRGILARADASGLPPSEEDQKHIDQGIARERELRSEIDRREAVEAAYVRAHDEPQGSAVHRPGSGVQVGMEGNADRPLVSPINDPRAEQRHQFRSAHEFFMKVRHAGITGQRDPRLRSTLPDAFGNEGIGADGGFLVPPEWSSEIARNVVGEESLLSMTSVINSTTGRFEFPADEDHAHASSGGIQAYWETEADTATASKVKVNKVSLKAHKITVLVPLTDEIIQDAAAISSFLQLKVPEKLNYKVNDALIRGNGVGMPLGLTQAPCQTGPTRNTKLTITIEDILGCWSRMPGPWRSSCVWLVNSEIEELLPTMTLSGSTSGVQALYMPPGGLADAPYARLLGRPIFVSEACSAPGYLGDFILWNPKKNATIVVGGGMRTDVSIHCYFEHGLTAYRFVMRLDSQPMLKDVIAPAHGSKNKSMVVMPTQKIS